MGKGKVKRSPDDFLVVRCEFCGETYLTSLNSDKNKRKLQAITYKSTLKERYTKEKVYAAWHWLERCPCADALVNLKDTTASEQANHYYYQKPQQKPSSRRERQCIELREKAIAFIQRQHQKARSLPGALSFPLFAEIEQIEKQFPSSWWEYKDDDERKAQWGIKHGPLWDSRLKVYSKATQHAHGRAVCERVLFGCVLEETESELNKITQVGARWAEEKTARDHEERERKAQQEGERCLSSKF
jgi:hypothetical protein